MLKHLTSLFDLAPDDLLAILDVAARLKMQLRDGKRPSLLKNHVLAQVFEKPSLRTRNSFEAAMAHLGGTGIFLSCADAGLTGRESVADVARVLSSYSDVISMRTFSQELIEQFAEFSTCPVINALSDKRHPCQALTDLLTMQETLGGLNGRKLVFVGDGNNVAESLAIAAAMTGIAFVLSAPEGFSFSESFLARLHGRYSDADVSEVGDPHAAVIDADIVYTDVWASMGQEAESEGRKKVFADYQVNAALMQRSPKTCRFMHDLPARRGLEVTDDVIDGAQSIVFQQAENRMHLAKGLLVWLLCGAGDSIFAAQH